MRQEPKILKVGGNTMLCWRAWGICTTDGTMAEVTLDPDKGSVWKQGGHKVIEFVHEEQLGEAAPSQGSLL